VASVPESPSLIPWEHLSGEYLASRLLVWKDRIAYAISQVASPPVLSSVGLVMTAAIIGTLRVWVLAVTYILLAIATPLAYLVWLLRRGQVTDFDVQKREQRIRPMQFTLVCGALAWLILAVAAAPRPVLLLTGALWVQMGIVFIITFWWKISVHCASAATLATIMGALIGTPLPLMIGLPLLAWSRVHRKRHTPAQAIAGMCLGYLVALFACLIAG